MNGDDETNGTEISALITGGMQLQLWLSNLGASRAMGTRWAKKKMIKPVRIGKLLYISTEQIKTFWARAEAGEFANELKGLCAPKAKAKKN